MSDPWRASLAGRKTQGSLFDRRRVVVAAASLGHQATAGHAAGRVVTATHVVEREVTTALSAEIETPIVPAWRKAQGPLDRAHARTTVADQRSAADVVPYACERLVEGDLSAMIVANFDDSGAAAYTRGAKVLMPSRTRACGHLFCDVPVPMRSQLALGRRHGEGQR